jgi:hypothetical protein
MKQLKHYTLLLFVLAVSNSVFAQNQNITLRSKISFPGQTVANMSGLPVRSMPW